MSALSTRSERRQTADGTVSMHSPAVLQQRSLWDVPLASLRFRSNTFNERYHTVTFVVCSLDLSMQETGNGPNLPCPTYTMKDLVKDKWCFNDKRRVPYLGDPLRPQSNIVWPNRDTSILELDPLRSVAAMPWSAPEYPPTRVPNTSVRLPSLCGVAGESA